MTRDIKSLKEDIKLIMADFNYPLSLTTSTEQDINNRLGKAWVALKKMNNIWKSTLPDNLKPNFFRLTVESYLMFIARSPGH